MQPLSSSRVQSHHFGCCLQAARDLLAVQEVALGAEHCDVATTLDALQQAMEYLMGTDKAALTVAFPDEWPTFAKASKAQYAYQKRCKAIQKLYEASHS